MRFVAVIVLLLMVAIPSWGAAPTKTQTALATGTGCNGANSSTCQTQASDWGANLTAGDYLWILMDWGAVGVTISSVVDSTNAGNTFTDCGLGRVSYDSGLHFLQCYSGKINTGGSKDVITLTLSATGNFPIMMLYETNTAFLDQSCSGIGGPTTSQSSGACPTTTDANELLLGYIATNGGNGLTAGSGWTLDPTATRMNDTFEAQTVSATGSYTATSTSSSSCQWGVILLTLRSTAPSVAARSHRSKLVTQ